MFDHIKNTVKTLSIVAAVALLTSAAMVTDTDEVVGTVVKIEGTAIAMQDASPRILQPKSQIFMGDMISTGKDSKIEIVMLDDAQFNLGSRTNFVVEEYFLKQDEGGAAVRLLQGAVAAVSGKIASLDTRPFVLNTQTATIGVRGTTFWGGEIDGTLQFALLDGKAIIVENKAGSVEINHIGQGTTVTSQNSVPTPPATWGKAKLDRAAAMTSIK